MEGAVGALRPAAAKVGVFHQPPGLLLYPPENPGDGQSLFRGLQAAPPEVGDGLNVNAPDVGGLGQGEAEDVPQGLIVNPRGHRRH